MELKYNLTQRLEAVRYCQIWLRKLKMLQDVADGIFGNNTRNAVSKFQEVYNLPITGVIDATTYGKLHELSRYKITVKGMAFVNWFNIFRLQHLALFPNPILPDFDKVFGELDALTGQETISLAEFVGHFAIIYNETGGRFQPLNEWGGDNNLDSFTNDAYFFEARQGKKQSYNRHPNRQAGNQLLDWGVIQTEKDVTIWNSETRYPIEQPEAVRRKARNCDFYKFRGRGLNQITWRNGYERHVNPALLAAGYQNIDQLNEAQLSEAFKLPIVYCGVFREYANDPTWAGKGVKALKIGIFTEYPKYVAGFYAQDYHQLYVKRCIALRDALQNNLQIL